MTKTIRLSGTILLTAFLLGGCGTTDQRLVDSIERLLNAATDELEKYRTGTTQPTPPEAEDRWILSDTGNYRLYPLATTSGGIWVLDVDDWGLWAKSPYPSDPGGNLFKVTIDTYAELANEYPMYEISQDGYLNLSNPEFSAKWTGRARGIDHDFLEAEGKAVLTFHSVTDSIDVHLLDFDNNPDQTWFGVPVSSGLFSNASEQRWVTGRFYGTEHEGVAGEFSVSSPRLRGVYGALRDLNDDDTVYGTE